jgi:hypothetical protein
MASILGPVRSVIVDGCEVVLTALLYWQAVDALCSLCGKPRYCRDVTGTMRLTVCKARRPLGVRPPGGRRFSEAQIVYTAEQL